MPGVILVWKVPRSNVLKQRRFRKVGRFGGCEHCRRGEAQGAAVGDRDGVAGFASAAANRLEALKGHRAGQHIAFESTINSASVFVGQPQGRKTLRLWTITEGGAAMHKLKSVPPGELLSM